MRLDDVFLLNGVSETQTRYGTMVAAANISGLHRAIGLRIVENDERIRGPEFGFLRKR